MLVLLVGSFFYRQQDVSSPSFILSPIRHAKTHEHNGRWQRRAEWLSTSIPAHILQETTFRMTGIQSSRQATHPNRTSIFPRCLFGARLPLLYRQLPLQRHTVQGHVQLTSFGL